MKKWLTVGVVLRGLGILALALVAQALIGLEVSDACREEVLRELKPFVS